MLAGERFAALIRIQGLEGRIQLFRTVRTDGLHISQTVDK
jgi:hypothetical protein